LTLLLFRQHNVISRRQALQWFTSAAIRNRLQRGRWRIAHRGVYIADGDQRAVADEDQRRWTASLSAGAGRPMPLGGLPALLVLGLRGFAEQDVHVMVPVACQRRQPAISVVVHRTRSLPREQVHWTMAPPCGAAPGGGGGGSGTGRAAGVRLASVTPCKFTLAPERPRMNS
jgi:hypothetical protein